MGSGMNGNNRSLVRAIRGPITLITVGALFALNNFTPYGFDQTWPVLLIVFGLLSLLRRGTEQAAAPPEGGRGFPPYGYPPPAGGYPPPSGPVSGYSTPPGSYRQSPYPGSAPSGDPGPMPPPGGSQ
jgi:hypothetical protein